MRGRTATGTPAVGVLLVGYGRRARVWHDVCRKHPGVVTVAGTVEPDPTARAAATAAGLQVFDTPAAAAAALPLAAAIVASPLDHHAPAAVACLHAGLAVLVEKPLALSVADATTIVDAAAGRGLPALVAQNFRYLRREQAVGRALADGAIGRPVSVEVESSRAIGPPTGPWESPDFRACDFILWDFVLHHLDAYRVRFGGPPAVVTATSPTAGGLRLDMTLAWAGGLEVRYRHDDDADRYRYRERVVGTDGVLTVDDQRVELVRDGRRTRTVRPPGRIEPEAAVLEEFLRVVAAGGDGRESPLAARENLLTVATVEAVARSLRHGGQVTL